jgi:hypothetical protein
MHRRAKKISTSSTLMPPIFKQQFEMIDAGGAKEDARLAQSRIYLLWREKKEGWDVSQSSGFS